MNILTNSFALSNIVTKNNLDTMIAKIKKIIEGSTTYVDFIKYINKNISEESKKMQPFFFPISLEIIIRKAAERTESLLHKNDSTTIMEVAAVVIKLIISQKVPCIFLDTASKDILDNCIDRMEFVTVDSEPGVKLDIIEWCVINRLVSVYTTSIDSYISVAVKQYEKYMTQYDKKCYAVWKEFLKSQHLKNQTKYFKNALSRYKYILNEVFDDKISLFLLGIDPSEPPYNVTRMTALIHHLAELDDGSDEYDIIYNRLKNIKTRWVHGEYTTENDEPSVNSLKEV